MMLLRRWIPRRWIPRRWQPLAATLQAVLATLIFAYFHSDTTAPIEVLWAVMGAVGSVFAFQVWRRRHRLNEWRKRAGINGEFALTTQGAVTLRLAGLIAELLILISGLAAMTTPASVRAELQINDLVTSLAVIGMGLSVTFSAWYADRHADRQAVYQDLHPDPEGEDAEPTNQTKI